MKNMTIESIAAACGGEIFLNGCGEICQKEIAGVTIDSRKVEKNFLFIATQGARVDGHEFINDAFSRGAAAAVCEKAPDNIQGPYILVKDSLQALKDIAKWYRAQLDIAVVGITGSVGKTTTKEFIASVLSQKYNTLKTEGNFNNEIGLPLTVLRIRDHHEVAVLEMGISTFGEMHRLSEIARPDICVITNIGQCHLETLHSREGVLKAKTEMFDFMSDSGRGCVCGDDDLLAGLGKVKGAEPIKYGIGAKNDVYATDIKSNGLFGSTCNINFRQDCWNNRLFDYKGLSNEPMAAFHVTVPLPGEFMVRNVLAAASVGILFGLNGAEIAAGIESVRSLGGRSNIIRKGSITIIDDCYNANPVSMKAALDLLSMADTRKVAVLGDMFELGVDEIALHAQIGRYAAARADLLVCAGALAEFLHDGALKALSESPENACDLVYFKTRDELIENLKSLIKDGDTVLVKASNGMGFKKVVESLLIELPDSR
ncbi:MAG TPA: UDP-N-acetylmuramoyl-tripeptide--D-alanyl-D-alanine ligase [Clostridia bacterium]|nr:UDP-N-acetylmuramoyl-tripeptide--D-alanyl-D-alanine ligase [Clostridia bacterium]